MITFNLDGINILLDHSKKTGFTFYEDEVKTENECFIKPIETKKRLSLFKNKDVGYFKNLYQKNEGVPIFDDENSLKNILV